VVFSKIPVRGKRGILCFEGSFFKVLNRLSEIAETEAPEFRRAL